MKECIDGEPHLWKVLWQRPIGSLAYSLVQCLRCKITGYKNG
jgi:hypothetical protein